LHGLIDLGASVEWRAEPVRQPKSQEAKTSKKNKTKFKKKGSGMRAQRVVLSLMVTIAAGIAAAGSASSEEYRGTVDQQMACTPDVWRLCFDQIPDVNRITACLRQNTPQLSGACRSVFESNASAQQQPQAQVQAPRGRAVQPPPRPRTDDDDQ
jgi:hypothetical protein